ncbi:RNA polymerase sigma factor SigJ [Microlunatus flavus]|uniref:RNA polymerase sigma factor SigJ n=1 Tax=Microlunatus flavus TaxID=1036181 RepID=UPI000B875B85|nr:RNA polymerase sigma factor SigJ [Microlunatus flavus]
MPAASDPLDDAAETFAAVRRRLFAVAYRMLGSWTEAEDVVQEAWLRWQGTDRSVVDNPVAFLTTTTARLALNVAQSARVRREAYLGPWLPEPVDTGADPTLGVERDQEVGTALLLLLERLTPTERAAYLLRESFDYAFGEVAEVLGTSPANARQLVSRARRHLSSPQRAEVAPGVHRRLMETFLQAAQSGDVAALERLLAEDVVTLSDGNGIRGVARLPVTGRERVAAFVAAFRARRFWDGAHVEQVEANGRPAALVRDAEGVPLAVLTMRATDAGIEELQWQLNPDKIAGFLRSGSRGD